MRNMSKILFTLLLALPAGELWAQTTPASHYDQHKAFDPLFYSTGSTVYRSASGVPGDKYWTNKVDYTIHTTLDTAAHSLRGEVTVAYTNNSPDELPFLWMQLDQNIYRQDSRGEAVNPVTGGRWSNKNFTE